MTDTLQAKSATVGAGNRLNGAAAAEMGPITAFTMPPVLVAPLVPATVLVAPSEPEATEQDPGDDSPMPDDEHEGEVVTFKRGDNTEIASRLVRDRQASSPFVFTEGVFWDYSGGIFCPVDESSLSRQVQSYAGLKVGKGNAARKLQVQAGTVKGATRLAADQIADPDYFEQARAGIGFADRFVEVSAEGIVARPHHPRHRSRAKFAFDYSDAEPTMLLDCFAGVFRGDSDADEKVCAIQEHGGISLIGQATTYQKALLLFGSPGTAKSTIMDILQAVVPENAVCSIQPQQLSTEHEYWRAQLRGKLVNIVAELSTSTISKSEGFKNAITGDIMGARDPGGRPMFFRPVAGHVLAANKLPPIEDANDGVWRRIIVIEFGRVFTERDSVKGLAQKIIEHEAGAIASWFLRGAQRLLQRNQYTIPASARSRLQAWRTESDEVLAFVSAKGLVKLDRHAPNKHGITVDDMHRMYCEWAREHRCERIESKIPFSKHMRKVGYPSKPAGTARRFRLRHPSPAEREAQLEGALDE